MLNLYAVLEVLIPYGINSFAVLEGEKTKARL